MKKLIFLIFFSSCFVPACKKDDIKTNQAVSKSTIKYEVNGTCCQMDLTFTEGGVTKSVTATNDFTWDYSYSETKGATVTLTGKSENGNEWTNIKIYQGGLVTKESQGYGTQTITDVVK